MAMYIDLYDHRNCYIGEDGEYQKWNIDPEVIKEAADVVEIVRCKDCKYYTPKHKTRFPELTFNSYCDIFAGEDMVGELKPNDFCSRGERVEK